LADVAGKVSTPDGNYLLCVELGSAIAPPLISITHVLDPGPEKQVTGIAAGRVVASVTNVEPNRYGAMGQHPGDTVCPKESPATPILLIAVHATVSICAAGELPRPTLIRFANQDIRPKALTQWNLRPRSDHEMCRIAATRIAAALQDISVSRTMRGFPRHAMSFDQRLAPQSIGFTTKLAAALSIDRPCPRPALLRVATFNMLPETIC
jgi:hypothetical protein